MVVQIRIVRNSSEAGRRVIRCDITVKPRKQERTCTRTARRPSTASQKNACRLLNNNASCAPRVSAQEVESIKLGSSPATAKRRQSNHRHQPEARGLGNRVIAAERHVVDPGVVAATIM